MTGNVPERHPTLGVPSKIYPYRNEKGDMVAAVYRFDTVNTVNSVNSVNNGVERYTPLKAVATGTGNNALDRYAPFNTGIQGGISAHNHNNGKKEIRPYCLIAHDWVRPVKPLLYDLETISSDRSRPVILVEGEKCVDALSKLGFLATTSMGGSNAAHFTDWSPLRGRDIIIWPDNDEPGQKYAASVAELCLQAGAASLAIVDLSPATIKRALGEGYAAPPIAVMTGEDRSSPVYTGLTKGWDAADAVVEGWGKKHIETLLSYATAYENRSGPVSANDNDHNNWPAPDMTILDREAPPPAFPLEIFPPALADWVIKTARSKSSPIDYVAATVLTGCASLIGSSRRVSPWVGWKEPIILWSMLVGSPSAGKSPAMDPVLSVLCTIEGDSLTDHAEALRLYETNKMEADLVRSAWERKAKDAVDAGGSPPILPVAAKAPDMPVRKRLTVRDATIEALLAALKGQPKGLLMVRDELAGWFASFDRYSGSKGGDRALWLEAYGGRPYTLDRVKNGGTPFHIPSLAIAVIGGIQPDRLQSCLLKGDDDGLRPYQV
ncbi:DUF3987 domain-containing protein [Kordiimonas pumila]|uniref:DUF3987 domain-containing protein n=1 Tax=Kordiimonas pumila TaxID=2161677 RepID=A0ABV7D7Y1_9PROT|nr:DUF3987 domain-containing protein [Kordiimonas pumila]